MDDSECLTSPQHYHMIVDSLSASYEALLVAGRYLDFELVVRNATDCLHDDFSLLEVFILIHAIDSERGQCIRLV